MNEHTVVVAAPQQVSSMVGDEVVILELERGHYFGLDGVGVRIWELLREPRRVAEVRDAIVAEYEVEPERCEADLIELLTRLADRGLIEVRGVTPG